LIGLPEARLFRRHGQKRESIVRHARAGSLRSRMPASRTRSTTTGPNKRRALRRDVHYPVAIEHLADGATTSCLIEDVSQTGVRLRVKDNAALPEEFILRLGANRVSHRHCRLVWREGDTVGVRFIDEKPA
jgi:hypothetical protein